MRSLPGARSRATRRRTASARDCRLRRVLADGARAASRTRRRPLRARGPRARDALLLCGSDDARSARASARRSSRSRPAPLRGRLSSASSILERRRGTHERGRRRHERGSSGAASSGSAPRRARSGSVVQEWRPRRSCSCAALRAGRRPSASVPELHRHHSAPSRSEPRSEAAARSGIAVRAVVLTGRPLVPSADGRRHAYGRHFVRCEIVPEPTRSSCQTSVRATPGCTAGDGRSRTIGPGVQACPRRLDGERGALPMVALAVRGMPTPHCASVRTVIDRDRSDPRARGLGESRSVTWWRALSARLRGASCTSPRPSVPRTRSDRPAR